MKNPSLLARLALLAALPSALLACGDGSKPAIRQAADVNFGNPTAPAGATRLGEAPRSETLRIGFGLTRDQEGLLAEAARVVDPASADYRRYRSIDEIAAAYGAAGEHRDAMAQHLRLYGIEMELDPTGTHAFADVPIAVAEEMFGVRFGLYSVPRGSEGDTRTGLYADAAPAGLAESVRGAVREVFGLSRSNFERRLAGAQSASNGATPWRTGTASGCADALDLTYDGNSLGLSPDQILTAYGIDQLHSAGFQGQDMRLALIEFEGFEPSDLDVFTSCFGVSSPDVTVHGDNVPSTGTGETILDLEVLAMVAPEAERTDVFIFDDSTTWAEAFATALDKDSTGGELPHVISVSWGLCEDELRGADYENSVDSTNYVLAAAALSGVGVYFAAGDSGSSDCYHERTLAVDWPGASPWVTVVGGTGLTLNDDNQIVSEGVWNDLVFDDDYGISQYAGGGGGTSTVSARPSWQSAPGVPSGDMRLVPDVSFFADIYPGYMVYCTTTGCQTKGWTTVGGTSAATPLFAGAVALVTQAALANGQSAPGFIAPQLYTLASDGDQADSVFNDVTLGDNDLYDVGCCSAGVGYDTASGIGSVKVAGLLEALVPGALGGG